MSDTLTTTLAGLQRLSLIVALLLAGWAVVFLLTARGTVWFGLANSAWLGALLLSAAWLQTGSFRALTALAFTTATVGRLFSTVRSEADGANSASAADPLLQVETGPGVPGFGYVALFLGLLLLVQFMLLARQQLLASAAPRTDLQRWVLTFLRLYTGLMFVPHFAGHLFAGPTAFAIYSRYFADLGLPFPSLMLVAAGTAEVVIGADLVLGIGTRLLSLAGAVYVLMTLLVGGHFSIGYVWILPDGGYEFGLLWAVLCGVFALVGADTPTVGRRSTGWTARPNLTG